MGWSDSGFFRSSRLSDQQHLSLWEDQGKLQSIQMFRCTCFSMKQVAPDHAWVQGPLFDFEPRTWTTLKVSFQAWSFSVFRNTLHFCAFRALSSPYLRSVYHPRYETMKTPRNWTKKEVRVSWFCWPVARPFLVNEQHSAKPLRPMSNVAWTTFVVHGRNTYRETSLLMKLYCQEHTTTK